MSVRLQLSLYHYVRSKSAYGDQQSTSSLRQAKLFTTLHAGCGNQLQLRLRRSLNLRRSFVLALAVFALASTCFAAEKPRIQVNDYIIHAVVTPQTHQLKAQARVKFTALEDINIATFELHNDLRPTRVIDTNGQTLSVERVSQDSTVRIALPRRLDQGQQRHADLRI